MYLVRSRAEVRAAATRHSIVCRVWSAARRTGSDLQRRAHAVFAGLCLRTRTCTLSTERETDETENEMLRAPPLCSTQATHALNIRARVRCVMAAMTR